MYLKQSMRSSLVTKKIDWYEFYGSIIAGSFIWRLYVMIFLITQWYMIIVDPILKWDDIEVHEEVEEGGGCLHWGWSLN